MLTSDIEVIDVIVDVKWQQPLLDAIDTISLDSHHNSSNYTGFKDRIQHYDCLTIVVHNGAILAFSGLYNGGIYPDNTIRALDRTYYFNHAKHDSSFNPNYRYNSQLFWPYQVNRAIELGYDSVFFSMQNIKKRNVFKKIAERCNPQPTVLPLLYNTCKIINGKINQDALCWQNIAIYTINLSQFELPTLEFAEYEQRYNNTPPIR